MGCKSKAGQAINAIAGALYPLENTTKCHKDQLLSWICRPVDGALHVGPVRVCKRAQRALLSIGWRRRSRALRGETDARFGKRARGDPRGRAPLAYASLYTHLWQVYTSHAETMPDADVILPANPTEPVSEENRNQVAAFRAASGTHLPPNPRMIQKGDLRFLIEPSEDCPVRRLPPGCRKDIWWLYLASMQEQGFKRPQGSYSTLKRVWKECFEKVLKFSQYGKHSACNTCSQLKAEMAQAASYADKLVKSKALCDHLERQWRDRMVYWRLKAVAAQEGSKWLCVIIDGADQAKFRVLKSIETPKALDGVERPKMKVEGCWVHGWELSFNFVEEDMPHNCNLTIEVLMRALDRCLSDWQSGAASGTPFPCHLWLQMDNCSGENKNVHVAKFASMLVDRNMFRSVTTSYLQVGHTHEDIDFLFSVMSTAIRKMGNWDNPGQMVERVQMAMDAHVTRTMKDIPVRSGMLDAVRDWKQWLGPLGGVDPHNGLVGIMSVHWMCFMRRKDIPISVIRDVAPASGSGPNDVMLLCKEYMSDGCCSQPPVLMLQAGASSALRPQTGPLMWEGRTNIPMSKIDTLCGKIEKYMPAHVGCAEYLRDWARKPRMHDPPPRALDCMRHNYGRALPGHDFATAFSEALGRRQHCPAPKALVVKRKRVNKDDAPWSVSLPHYVNARCSQGISVDDAVNEWNGGRLVHGVTE